MYGMYKLYFPRILKKCLPGCGGDYKNAMPLQFAFRRDDVFAQATGLLDGEIRPGLAKFFESPIDSFERIVR